MSNFNTNNSELEEEEFRRRINSQISINSDLASEIISRASVSKNHAALIEDSKLSKEIYESGVKRGFLKPEKIDKDTFVFRGKKGTITEKLSEDGKTVKYHPSENFSGTVTIPRLDPQGKEMKDQVDCLVYQDGKLIAATLAEQGTCQLNKNWLDQEIIKLKARQAVQDPTIARPKTPPPIPAHLLKKAEPAPSPPPLNKMLDASNKKLNPVKAKDEGPKAPATLSLEQQLAEAKKNLKPISKQPSKDLAPKVPTAPQPPKLNPSLPKDLTANVNPKKDQELVDKIREKVQSRDWKQYDKDITASKASSASKTPQNTLKSINQSLDKTSNEPSSRQAKLAELAAKNKARYEEMKKVNHGPDLTKNLKKIAVDNQSLNNKSAPELGINELKNKTLNKNVDSKSGEFSPKQPTLGKKIGSNPNEKKLNNSNPIPSEPEWLKKLKELRKSLDNQVKTPSQPASGMDTQLAKKLAEQRAKIEGKSPNLNNSNVEQKAKNKQHQPDKAKNSVTLNQKELSKFEAQASESVKPDATPAGAKANKKNYIAGRWQ